MNLKEAFRCQNKLVALMDEAQQILDREENVTRVENTYLRRKVMPEAANETILVAAETDYYDCITDVARFLLFLLDQKAALFCAIRKAKEALPLDLDSEVSLNTTRRSLAKTFRRMNTLRSGEQIFANGGTGYRFNAEGNQISYRCDVKKVTTINFDRKVIRSALDGLNKRADDISTRLDLAMVTSQVDYELPFDVNDGFDEAFEAFRSTAGA